MSRKINFRENNLSMDCAEAMGKWKEQLDDVFVATGLNPTIEKPEGSLEGQLKKVNDEVAVLEKSIKERETISNIAEGNRSPADRNALKALASASKMANDLSELKKERIRLDNKIVDLNRSCKEIDVFVDETVDVELYDVYRGKRKESADDRAKQIKEGLKEIGKKLNVGISLIAASLKANLAEEGRRYSTTVSNALKKIVRITKAVEQSKTLAEDFGTTLVISDEEALAALLAGIRAKDGVGNVPQTAQALIDAASITPTTFEVLREKLTMLLQGVSVRDRVSVGKGEEEDDGSAFKASTTTQPVSTEMEQKIAQLETRVKELSVQNEKHTTLLATANFAARGGSTGQHHYQAYAATNTTQQQSPWRPGAGGGAGGKGGNAYGGGGGGGQRGICYDFQKGKCDRGDSCRFEHVMGAKKPVCQYDGTCTSRFCKYDHPNGKARSSTPLTGGKRKP